MSRWLDWTMRFEWFGVHPPHPCVILDPWILGRMIYHQKFQVPKMEVLNLIRLFGGWVFPYISLTNSLYRWVPPFELPEMFGESRFVPERSHRLSEIFRYSTDRGSSDTPFCSMFAKGFISTPEVCGVSVGGDRHSQKVGKSKGLWYTMNLSQMVGKYSSPMEHIWVGYNS